MAAKKRTEKKTEGEEIHVAIRDPAIMRQAILESARISVEFLKRRARMEAIREEKLRLYGELRTELNSITSQMNKLHKTLPKVKVSRQAIRKTLMDDAKLLEPDMDEKSVHHMRGRMHELDSELSDIENRLRRIK